MRKPVEPVIDRKQAEQLIKCSAVVLRDHSRMSFEDAMFAFMYCWKFTETEAAAEERERSS